MSGPACRPYLRFMFLTPSAPAAVPSDHDVVVVGGRAAGAATAMLLARAGHDVVVVDRAQLPSDTTSTHSLVRGGVVQLSRWGLLDDVLDSGAPPVRSVLFQQYGGAATEPLRLPVKDKAGVDMMLAPRRYVLDAILADAATRAGATLLTGTTVTDVLRDADGRVTGVLAHGADGTSRQLSARLVIGADGVRSRMAELFGAQVRESYDLSGTCLYTYVGGVAWDGFEFHLGDRAFAGVFPTHHGEAAVWLIRPSAQLTSVLTAGAGRLEAWLRALQTCAPDLAERVLAGSVNAPLRGSIGLPNHVRQAAGPGWALVGDAGYHRDPITGHGLTDAFRDAELLADAADAVLRAAADEQTAMTAYERQRDAAIRDTFRITRALAVFPPPEQFAELQVELSRALDLEARQLAARPALTHAVSVC
jgi:2-polyprenyl-6-methoxyphenol hydroxylase-like FAD-dependent oxidoreductase